ncbi:hypothetical protein [Salinimonas chungwhensis]|uniref:hypothetical protein n=1 Tax=Salinimonas chungwhensis TaxID=265425 RepID=UPI00035E99D5|nr:hypothetical protein [Salinimonas chungwhensis]
MKKIFITLTVVIIGIVGYLAWLSDESASDKPVPVITVMDILNASDLSAGVKQAIKNEEPDEVMEWLEKGQNVGEEAGLSKPDLDYLTSEQAKDYVVFNARRELFNEGFEKRYAALQPIADLKKQYPEAKSLFAKADAIIDKRDAIIEQIALTLAEGKSVTQQHQQAARELWQQRYQSRQNDGKVLDDAGR